MKNMIIGAAIASLLVFTTISTANFPTMLDKNEDVDIYTLEEEIKITLTQSSNFIGMTMVIENTGTDVLTDIVWSFRYKAAITGTGIFINEKIEKGRIDSINPDTTETLRFTPFGLGNIYFNASVKINGFSYRAQQRAYLALIIPLMFRDTYKDITPAEAYQRLENDEFDLVIDVVGLDIYSLGHLPGAVNYVWADGTLKNKIPELDPDWTYLVYCHTDPPSTDSAQSLIDAGFTDVFRLEGNYAAWKNQGYPIEI